MKRYFVCLLFDSQVDDDSETSKLTEESIRLVIAADENEALEKAQAFGRESEHEYFNDTGARVSWRFIRIVDVQEYCEDEIEDGSEVYSRLNTKDIDSP